MRGLVVVVVVLGAIVATTGGVAAPAPETLGVAQASPTPSLQDLVNAADPGSVVVVPAGIYRETVTVDKPLTLVAEPGAEVRGSDVWTEWDQTSNGWLSERSVPPLPARGTCAASRGDACRHPEQVFRDGLALQPVASAPVSGQFVLDAQRHVILADDPTGHTLEVSVRQRWVYVTAGGVTLDGFSMKHAANAAQTGAIENAPGVGPVTLTNSQLSEAHGALVALVGGTGHTLAHNDLGWAGQLGLRIGGQDTGANRPTHVLVQDNVLHDNNTAGFDSTWEAGGLKALMSTDLVLDQNEASGNNGPGLWCDIDCAQVVYSNNRVHDNAGPGIMFEIGDTAQIVGNAVWNNGWSNSGWGWGGGIVLAGSKNVEVGGNSVAWNGDGISIISQDRSTSYCATGCGNDDAQRWNRVANIFVHDNVIVHSGSDPSDPGGQNVFLLAWLQDWKGQLFAPAANNRAARNAVWQPQGGSARFGWADRVASVAEAQNVARPGWTDTRVLSDADKDQLLAAAAIPLQPQPR